MRLARPVRPHCRGFACPRSRAATCVLLYGCLVHVVLAPRRSPKLIMSEALGASFQVLLRFWHAAVTGDTGFRWPSAPAHTAWLPRRCSYSCMDEATMS